MLEKNGMLTDKSQSDFSHEKVAFVDDESPYVAGVSDKDKLKKPRSLKELNEKEENNG